MLKHRYYRYLFYCEYFQHIYSSVFIYDENREIFLEEVKFSLVRMRPFSFRFFVTAKTKRLAEVTALRNCKSGVIILQKGRFCVKLFH